MPPLSQTPLLLLLAARFAHAMTSPWTLLPVLRNHISSPECVNGATLPAYWSISDLSVDYTTAGGPEEASFMLGSSQIKSDSRVTCRNLNGVGSGSGFECKGHEEGVKVSLRVPRRVEGSGVVVVVGISEPRACGGVDAVVEGEVEVGVDCPGSAAGAGRGKGACGSKRGEVRAVDGVVTVQGAGGLGREKFVKVKTQGVQNPWARVAKGLLGGGKGGKKGGKKKMSPLLVELRGDAAGEKKGEQKSEVEEMTSEKDLIDAMEDKLCSPSCLGETMPAPESGVQWTNGKKNLQVELRKRRPPSLGRGKPMMW